MEIDSVTLARIKDEVKKESPDWHLVEVLTRGIVDSDPNRVRFNVDAGHIKKLGDELVGKQETALIELVKNAYDADATKVSVKLVGADSPGGTLIVEDDGNGMTQDVVRNSWMTVSTPDKVSEPISPLYHRVRAGRKGIGRFATQRLGRKLILETGVTGSSTGTKVVFDWESQFVQGERINDIFSQVSAYTKPVEVHGTRLTIEKTSERWTKAELDRAADSVIFLRPSFFSNHPNAEETGSNDRSQIDDPGFEVEINGHATKGKEVAINFRNHFLDHAIATITGEINEDGSASVTVVSKKLELNETNPFDDKFLVTGPLRFEAYYFIYLTTTMPGRLYKTAAQFGREYGGVKVYKNGFRVLPYGDVTDDWLKLDVDSSRRFLLVPANNRNFFGHVELTDSANPFLEETSSRQGLIDNESLVELRNFVRGGLEWAAKRVANVRAKKAVPGPKRYSPPTISRPSHTIDQLLQAASTAPSHPDLSAAGLVAVPQTHLQALKENLEAWEQESERQRRASLQYEEMLRILASMGLAISVFGHEIRGSRSSILGYVQLLRDKIEILHDGARTDLSEVIGDLDSATSRMFDIGGYITSLMSATGSKELKSLSVRGAIDRFYKQFEYYLEKQRVVVTVDVEPSSLRTTPMHASEIDSVLLNFLTNSLKSIKKTGKKDRRIRISARKDGKYVLLAFEDNGVGIPPEHADRVFEAFFTTTTNTEEDVLIGPGAGLGLKIVSDIAQSYGGEASVGTPTGGYNCRIEFRILALEDA